MHALIIGNGGREHALAVSVAKSPLISRVFVAPGNGGTGLEFENLAIHTDDFESVAQCIIAYQVQLIIIGPEKPLVDGLVDFLLNHPHPWMKSLHIIGPDKFCAQLEGSKAFSKMVMEKAGIPTAKAVSFQPADWEKCQQYIHHQPLPIVIKADGLASGKGVAVCSDRAEAIAFAKAILLDGAFGIENQQLLVEDFLDGIEVSMFVLTDGKVYVWLPDAKDYKRIFDGDRGLNTGGMGSVSPVPFVDQTFRKKVANQVVDPLLQTMASLGHTYKGFLFIGLMNVQEEPYVVEFNARLGDPETQTILQRLEGDWVESLLSLKKQKLAEHPIRISDFAAATVVIAAANYPGKPRTDDAITIDNSMVSEGRIFHSGTKLIENQLKTAGGRVFGCTGKSKNPGEALKNAYRLCGQIQFEGMYFRKDIGRDLFGNVAIQFPEN